MNIAKYISELTGIPLRGETPEEMRVPFGILEVREVKAEMNIAIHASEIPTIYLNSEKDEFTIEALNGEIVVPLSQLDPFIRALMAIRAIHRPLIPPL